MSQIMSEHTELGKQGEIIAAEYLLKNGYEILHRNWHFKKLELDIVATKGSTLIIVEVKSRSSEYFENPKDAITLKKQKHLFNAAEYYIEIYDYDKDIQFDIITIIFQNERHELEHIEDAFRPGW